MPADASIGPRRTTKAIIPRVVEPSPTRIQSFLACRAIA